MVASIIIEDLKRISQYCFHDAVLKRSVVNGTIVAAHYGWTASNVRRREADD
jgi:hypothetical protein